VRLDLADQLQALLLGVVDLALERADLVLEGDQQGHVLARRGGLVLDLAHALALDGRVVLELLDAHLQLLHLGARVGQLLHPAVELGAALGALGREPLELRLGAEDVLVELLETEERSQDFLHGGRRV
jgi:hypothetical protein